MKKVGPEHPVLQSTRLRMRPFSLDDIPEVNRLVGDYDVATPLIAVDYPYTEDDARRWILRHRPGYEVGGALNFAVEQREDGALVGFIGIGGNDSEAGMGYWYGRSFWGNGYATEAGRTTLAFGFEELLLQRVKASHLSSNGASGRVLQKMDMRFIGRNPHYYPKWGKHCDKDEYAITWAGYQKACTAAPDNYRYRRMAPP